MIREEVEALLPFHVNGTLQGEEAEAVEQALAADLQLRDEAESLSAIRDTMQEDEDYSPGEIGLARLMRSIDEIEAPDESPPPQDEPVAPGIAPGKGIAAPEKAVAPPVEPVGTRARPGFGSRLWHVATALLLAVAVVQGLVLAGRDAEGGPPGAAALTLSFANDAPESAIRALLLEAGVEIVSGPSALGQYAVSVREGTRPEAAFDALSASALVLDVTREAP